MRIRRLSHDFLNTQISSHSFFLHLKSLWFLYLHSLHSSLSNSSHQHAFFFHPPRPHLSSSEHYSMQHSPVHRQSCIDPWPLEDIQLQVGLNFYCLPDLSKICGEKTVAVILARAIPVRRWLHSLCKKKTRAPWTSVESTTSAWSANAIATSWSCAAACLRECTVMEHSIF